MLRWQYLAPLGNLLHQVADLLGAATYQDHYQRDLGTLLRISHHHQQRRQGRQVGNYGPVHVDTGPTPVFLALYVIFQQKITARCTVHASVHAPLKHAIVMQGMAQPKQSCSSLLAYSWLSRTC